MAVDTKNPLDAVVKQQQTLTQQETLEHLAQEHVKQQQVERIILKEKLLNAIDREEIEAEQEEAKELANLANERMDEERIRQQLEVAEQKNEFLPKEEPKKVDNEALAVKKLRPGVSKRAESRGVEVEEDLETNTVSFKSRTGVGTAHCTFTEEGISEPVFSFNPEASQYEKNSFQDFIRTELKIASLEPGNTVNFTAEEFGATVTDGQPAGFLEKGYSGPFTPEQSRFQAAVEQVKEAGHSEVRVNNQSADKYLRPSALEPKPEPSAPEAFFLAENLRPQPSAAQKAEPIATPVQDQAMEAVNVQPVWDRTDLNGAIEVEALPEPSAPEMALEAQKPDYQPEPSASPAPLPELSARSVEPQLNPQTKPTEQTANLQQEEQKQQALQQKVEQVEQKQLEPTQPNPTIQQTQAERSQTNMSTDPNMDPNVVAASANTDAAPSSLRPPMPPKPTAPQPTSNTNQPQPNSTKAQPGTTPNPNKTQPQPTARVVNPKKQQEQLQQQQQNQLNQLNQQNQLAQQNQLNQQILNQQILDQNIRLEVDRQNTTVIDQNIRSEGAREDRQVENTIIQEEKTKESEQYVETKAETIKELSGSQPTTASSAATPTATAELPVPKPSASKTKEEDLGSGVKNVVDKGLSAAKEVVKEAAKEVATKAVSAGITAATGLPPVVADKISSVAVQKAVDKIGVDKLAGDAGLLSKATGPLSKVAASPSAIPTPAPLGIK